MTLRPEETHLWTRTRCNGRVRAAALALACLLAACSGGDRAEDGRAATPEVRVGDGDPVVARVNGVSITASRVARLAEETGRTPEEVVDRLIAFELLAQEAHRRGLRDDREVRAEARKAMVHRFLELDFEATHRPEDISEENLRAAYEKNRHIFVRPKLLRVAHILVLAREKQATEAQRRQAFALAQKIYRDAAKAESFEAFRDLAVKYDGREGFEVRLEDIQQPVHRRARLERSFVDAALKLKRIGEVSPPVKTSYGAHVIYLKDFKEPINRSFEEVREQVREQEYPFWRRAAFFEMIEDLMEHAEIKGYQRQRRRIE